jgi:hypothetical protein
VNILAVSLPFSTAIMLGIFSFGEAFTSPTLLISIGILMVILSASKPILKWITPLEWKAELKKSLGSLF